MSTDMFCGIIIAVAIVVAVLWGIFWGWVEGEATKCPKCNTPYAKQEVSKRETGRRKGYKTIEREERNSNGDVIRRWHEQIRILTVDYEHTYKCPKCDHTWTATSSKEYDSFDE